jgi:sporulation protein YlmC with PRC-barrel domain
MAENNNIITSDDILGKVAVDPDGEILGVVMKLHIGKAEKKLLGITIDQGFMKPDLFIGMYYIKNFGVDAVFLNRVPTDKFMGLDVMTADGKDVGKVKNVNAKNHRVQEIIISKKGVMPGKRFAISSSDIQRIGTSVVLKEGYKLREI